MNRWIDLETPHGPVRARRCEPAGPSRGAVVVIQEIFGVNRHIRHVAEQFAQDGFIAMAPALFDPIEKAVELDYDAAGIARGRKLANAVGMETAVDVVGTAADQLHSEGLRTAAVGFCWGGTVALLANTRLGLPAVSYYGARNVPFLDEPLRAPIQFHFGQRDRNISAADVQLHRDKHPGATVHVYPAGHGFNCELRDDHEPASATLAWQRTTGFLAENLR
ncbi:dienelactone hydrolase family protein [Lysobacter sp. A286]